MVPVLAAATLLAAYAPSVTVLAVGFASVRLRARHLRDSQFG
jgi:hypothetical protein